MIYTWGYPGSDEQYVYVALDQENGRTEDLFDVTLYDPECLNPDTGLNGMEESLRDLRRLIGLANAALSAGLEPTAVPDRQEA